MSQADLSTLLSDILLRQERLEQQNRSLLEELQSIKTDLRAKLVQAGEGWLDTRPAAAALELSGIRGVRQLRELLYRGVFNQERGEIRNTGTEARPNWQYNIPRCKDAIAHFYALPEPQRDAQFPKRVA